MSFNLYGQKSLSTNENPQYLDLEDWVSYAYPALYKSWERFYSHELDLDEYLAETNPDVLVLWSNMK